jgi:1-deoxy-D-xylulose 5-phosphate reductoisomerase
VFDNLDSEVAAFFSFLSSQTEERNEKITLNGQGGDRDSTQALHETNSKTLSVQGPEDYFI